MTLSEKIDDSLEKIRTPAPLIAGLTDGIPEVVLQMSWNRALDKLEQSDGDPYCLLDDSVIPYAISLKGLEGMMKSFRDGKIDAETLFTTGFEQSGKIDSIDQLKEHFPPPLLVPEKNGNVYNFWLKRFDFKDFRDLMRNYVTDESANFYIGILGGGAGLKVDKYHLFEFLDGDDFKNLAFWATGKANVNVGDIKVILQCLRAHWNDREAYSNLYPVFDDVTLQVAFMNGEPYRKVPDGNYEREALVNYLYEQLGSPHCDEMKIREIGELLGDTSVHMFQRLRLLSRDCKGKEEDVTIKDGLKDQYVKFWDKAGDLINYSDGADVSLNRMKEAYPQVTSPMMFVEFVKRQDKFIDSRARKKTSQKGKLSSQEKRREQYYRVLWELLLQDASGESLVNAISLYTNEDTFRRFIFRQLNKDEELARFMKIVKGTGYGRVKVFAGRILAEYMNDKGLKRILDGLIDSLDDLRDSGKSEILSVLLSLNGGIFLGAGSKVKMDTGEGLKLLVDELVTILCEKGFIKWLVEGYESHALWDTAYRAISDLPFIKAFDMEELVQAFIDRVVKRDSVAGQEEVKIFREIGLKYKMSLSDENLERCREKIVLLMQASGKNGKTYSRFYGGSESTEGFNVSFIDAREPMQIMPGLARSSFIAVEIPSIKNDHYRIVTCAVLDGDLNLDYLDPGLEEHRDLVVALAMNFLLEGIDLNAPAAEAGAPISPGFSQGDDIKTVNIDLAGIKRDLDKIEADDEEDDGSVDVDVHDVEFSDLNKRVGDLLAEVSDDNVKMVCLLHEGAVDLVDFDKLYLFQAIPNGNGKNYYRRLKREEILALAGEGKWDQMFMIKNKPHLKTLPYSKNPRKPGSDEVMLLSPEDYSEDRLTAYAYYLEAGLPYFGDLEDKKCERSVARIRIPGQARYQKTTLKYPGENGEQKEVKGHVRVCETRDEVNGMLVDRLSGGIPQSKRLGLMRIDPKIEDRDDISLIERELSGFCYFPHWNNRQMELLEKRIVGLKAEFEKNPAEDLSGEILEAENELVARERLSEAVLNNTISLEKCADVVPLILKKKSLEKEIEAITASEIPDGERNARLEELKEVAGKIEAIINRIFTDENGKPVPLPGEEGLDQLSSLFRGRIQVGLGWLPVNPTFNQGSYETVESLFSRISSEKKRGRKKYPLEIGPAPDEVAEEITGIKDILDRYESLMREEEVKLRAEAEAEAAKAMDQEKAKKILENAEKRIMKNKKANKAHCRLLCDAVLQLMPNCDHMFEQHRKKKGYDLLTVRGDKAILWELKSINESGGNERGQLKSAIGQLGMYAADSIAGDPRHEHLYDGLTKVVLFQKKPVLRNGLLATVERLEAKGVVYILWFEDGQMKGSEKALAAIGSCLNVA
jgi:hypothetical protein